MPVRKLTRNDADFYACLGPVFGSRLIEKETRDRFYDDPGKVWYLAAEAGAASVLGATIRNFWAADGETAAALILAILADVRRPRGILPALYEKDFRRLGFHTAAFRRNFIEVYYEETD